MFGSRFLINKLATPLLLSVGSLFENITQKDFPWTIPQQENELQSLNRKMKDNSSLSDSTPKYDIINRNIGSMRNMYKPFVFFKIRTNK